MQEIEKLEAEIKRLRRLIAQGHDGPFIASKLRPHFHRPHCEWVLCMSRNNIVEYSSHGEAVEAGLKPCKTCRA
jgi:methylphosphotriester-DNA--protein-cysteine methyltransferase